MPAFQPAPRPGPPRLSSRLSTTTKVNAGFGAALLLLALVAAVAQVATTRLNRTIALVEHTHEVLNAVERIRTDLRAAEAAHRGYVATAAAAFLDEYHVAADSLRAGLALLHTLTRDNPAQQERLDALDEAARQRVAYFESGNALRAAGQQDAAEQAVEAGGASPLRAQMNALLGSVQAGEQALLEARKSAMEQTLRRTQQVTVIAVILSALVVLLASWMINGDIRVRRRAERALQDSELRLRDFLDSASDLIQSNAPDGSLLYVNRSWLRTLGYTEQEVVGRPALDFIAPESREYCIEAGRAIMERAEPAEVAFTLQRRDGQRVHVRGNTNARFEDGQAVAIRSILRDVTRQREVDRMKDEFISIVSHELRTPLTSIRGSLGLLGGGLLGELPERGRRMLDVAITNTDRLVRLINDILDVERIESGQAPMVKRHVELAELVAQTAEAVQPLASKAGVTLSLETTPVEVDADPDRIVQTITNLLSNAIKFSTPGSTVRVALAAVDGRAHLRVIDTGRGIPTDKLGLIFDRFQQVDASDAREKGGTGLGLAISRTIVQQHGGEIWAESEPGAGATFHVRLPALGVPLRVLPGPQDESRLVLVCDGDASACEALNDILVGRGYRVLCARTGADAVALAVEHRPALVLLDLQMTGTDGWQTLAELKERPETGHIPVIIMSGTDYSGDESVVMKPVDPQALFSEIDRAMVRWARGEVLLLVEDDLDLAAVLIEFFERQGLRPVHARTGAEAITLSRQTSPSLLVLDLMLPEVDGFRVIDWLRQHDRLKDVPIFVYTARDLDETERARVGLQPERLLTKSRVPPEELVDRVVGVIGRVTRLERENASG